MPFPRYLFSWRSYFVRLVQVPLLREAFSVHCVWSRNMAALFTTMLLHFSSHSADRYMLLWPHTLFLRPLPFFLIRKVPWGHWPFCLFSFAVDTQWYISFRCTRAPASLAERVVRGTNAWSRCHRAPTSVHCHILSTYQSVCQLALGEHAVCDGISSRILLRSSESSPES